MAFLTVLGIKLLAPSDRVVAILGWTVVGEVVLSLILAWYSTIPGTLKNAYKYARALCNKRRRKSKRQHSESSRRGSASARVNKLPKNSDEL